MSTSHCGLVAVFIALAMPAAGQVDNNLIPQPGWRLVQSHCAACHSTRLITSQRMPRARWRATIRWMQDKHNLWPLGDAEKPILDYLATHYGLDGQREVRRKNLAIHRPLSGE